jgi:hypothetical protein
MAGKAGQKGAKATAIPLRYASGFMAELDGRSAVARELRGRLDDLMADLGGVEVLSYQRRSLCERAIHLEARLQSLEAAFAQGTAENGDESRYAALTNSLLGIFRTLGLDRRARELTLGDYLANREETRP